MLFRTSCWAPRCKGVWALPRIRSAQTAAGQANPYSFPSGRHPTPHQIFHLPKNASERDIKSRYYDLVRIYHPDKADGSLSSEAAHAKFQSITNAYDVLRGKTPAVDFPFSSSSPPAEDHRYPTTAAWRARSRRQELYTGKDERWKDRVILFGLVVTVAILVVQVFSMRRQALSEAVARTRHLDVSHRRRTSASVASLDPDDPDQRLGG